MSDHHTPHDDPEWGDLLQAWHEDDEATTDTPMLPEQEDAMRTETRKLILDLVGEYAAALFVVAFYAVMLSYDPNIHVVALAAASVMFLIIYLGVMTTLFWRSFRPDVHTTEAYLALSRRRLTARLSWSSFVQLSSVCFGGFMALWAVWFVLDQTEPVRMLKGIALPMLGVYAILGGVIYFARRDKRKRTTELEELDALMP